jgi:hypothetical protein
MAKTNLDLNKTRILGYYRLGTNFFVREVVDEGTAAVWDNPIKYLMLLRWVPLVKNML